MCSILFFIVVRERIRVAAGEINRKIVIPKNEESHKVTLQSISICSSLWARITNPRNPRATAGRNLIKLVF